MPFAADLQRAVKVHVGTQVMPRARQRVALLLDVNEPRRRTGALHRSQRFRQSFGALTPALTVEYIAEHATYTEEGTRAHVIRAKRGKTLRFVKGGKVIYRRQVMWRPGPGVARNKGWFAKRSVSARAWHNILSDVTS
jgi:hypothetical protein